MGPWWHWWVHVNLEVENGIMKLLFTDQLIKSIKQCLILFTGYHLLGYVIFISCLYLHGIIFFLEYL